MTYVLDRALSALFVLGLLGFLIYPPTNATARLHAEDASVVLAQAPTLSLSEEEPLRLRVSLPDTEPALDPVEEPVSAPELGLRPSIHDTKLDELAVEELEQWLKETEPKPASIEIAAPVVLDEDEEEDDLEPERIYSWRDTFCLPVLGSNRCVLWTPNYTARAEAPVRKRAAQRPAPRIPPACAKVVRTARDGEIPSDTVGILGGFAKHAHCSFAYKPYKEDPVWKRAMRITFVEVSPATVVALWDGEKGADLALAAAQDVVGVVINGASYFVPGYGTAAMIGGKIVWGEMKRSDQLTPEFEAWHKANKGYR